jgi:hypothetical protein
MAELITAAEVFAPEGASGGQGNRRLTPLL